MDHSNTFRPILNNLKSTLGIDNEAKFWIQDLDVTGKVAKSLLDIFSSREFDYKDLIKLPRIDSSSGFAELFILYILILILFLNTF